MVRNYKKNIALVALAVSISFPALAAVDASRTFVWQGTVPPAPTGQSYAIASPTGTEPEAGKLDFTVDRSNKVTLKNASVIDFNVFKMNGNTIDINQEAFYKYTLTSIRISNSSNMLREQAVDGYFEITANGSTLTKKVESPETKGVTRLSVKAHTSNTADIPAAGDYVSLYAAVVVSDSRL